MRCRQIEYSGKRSAPGI